MSIFDEMREQINIAEQRFADQITDHTEYEERLKEHIRKFEKMDLKLILADILSQEIEYTNKEAGFTLIKFDIDLRKRIRNLYWKLENPDDARIADLHEQAQYEMQIERCFVCHDYELRADIEYVCNYCASEGRKNHKNTWEYLARHSDSKDDDVDIDTLIGGNS